MELRNCPDEFYENCSNQIRKCRTCAAGMGKANGRVLYIPIEESEPHPYKYIPPRKPAKDKTRSRIVKTAQTSERKQTRKLAENVESIARQTIASGRVNGDGDAIHSIPNVMDLRVEQKRRAPGSTFSVTSAEYQKGLRQGIHVWEIVVPDKGTMYILREEIYAELLALARINNGKTTTI